MAHICSKAVAANALKGFLKDKFASEREVLGIFLLGVGDKCDHESKPLAVLTVEIHELMVPEDALRIVPVSIVFSQAPCRLLCLAAKIVDVVKSRSLFDCDQVQRGTE